MESGAAAAGCSNQPLAAAIAFRTRAAAAAASLDWGLSLYSACTASYATSASGSHLVLWDGTNTSPAVVSGADRLAEMGGVPYILRSPEDLASCFSGLTMVEPGLVPIPLWRPDDADAKGIDAYGAVARKL